MKIAVIICIIAIILFYFFFAKGDKEYAKRMAREQKQKDPTLPPKPRVKRVHQKLGKLRH